MLIKSDSYKYTFAVNKEGKKRVARRLATGPRARSRGQSLPASSLLWSALKRHTGVTSTSRDADADASGPPRNLDPATHHTAQH